MQYILMTLLASAMWGSWMQSTKHLDDFPMEGFILILYTTSLVVVWTALFFLKKTMIPDGLINELAVNLAKWINSHNYSLVYGGGNVGLIETMASTVLELGNTVYGIIPKFLVESEEAKMELDNLEIVNTMQERKIKMIELSDLFVALPGGPGTMEEITEVVSLYISGEHSKPIYLLNHNGFYDNLKSQYFTMIDHGFLDINLFEK